MLRSAIKIEKFVNFEFSGNARQKLGEGEEEISSKSSNSSQISEILCSKVGC